MPVIAAEGSARQAHLHDVEELAVAGVDLDLAVVQQVVGAADARRDLVSVAELNGRKACGIVGRLGFLVETDAIRLIKYKEIYAVLETATDRCEDAANVMESILVKNA